MKKKKQPSSIWVFWPSSSSSTLQPHHTSFHACVLKVYVRELVQKLFQVSIAPEALESQHQWTGEHAAKWNEESASRFTYLFFSQTCSQLKLWLNVYCESSQKRILSVVKSKAQHRHKSSFFPIFTVLKCTYPSAFIPLEISNITQVLPRCFIQIKDNDIKSLLSRTTLRVI